MDNMNKANSKIPFFSNRDMQDIIPQLDEFQNVYDILLEADMHDEELLSHSIPEAEMQKIFPNGNNAARRDLKNLVEQVWDIAYQMGYRNGTKDVEEYFND